MDLGKLREGLTTYFSNEELKDLCFDLTIDYEEFGQAKSELARGLVTACQQEGKLPDLIEMCEKKRPKVSWRDD